MPKTVASLIFLLCIVSPAGIAAAQTAATAGSNIALSEYPGPPCSKPQAPVNPELPAARNEASTAEAFATKAQNEAKQAEAYNTKVRQYNKDVAVYNAAIKEFNSCMQSYVDNGNADMMRIKQKLDAAVAAANAH